MFPASLAKTLQVTGYKLISGDTAIRYVDAPLGQLPIRCIVRQESKDLASYKVTQGMSILATGRESHGAYAAMVANEAAWSARDAQRKLCEESAP